MSDLITPKRINIPNSTDFLWKDSKGSYRLMEHRGQYNIASLELSPYNDYMWVSYDNITYPINYITALEKICRREDQNP